MGGEDWGLVNIGFYPAMSLSDGFNVSNISILLLIHPAVQLDKEMKNGKFQKLKNFSLSLIEYAPEIFHPNDNISSRKAH